MRGRLYQHYRPDLILRDDLEIAITADSPVVTDKIVCLLDEAKGGLAGHGVPLTLGNYIIEDGGMGYVRKAVDGSGRRVRFVPILPRQGKIAWSDKYIKSDREATALNEHILDSSKRKISLDTKWGELNAGGRRVYEVEMLLDPVDAGPLFFDRVTIERLVAACAEPRQEKTGFTSWAKYDSADR
jgi:hypothetical protein